jgi:catechol 2,3-dioxygenase-like lactoylglutathione lyase family enzyme
VNDTSTATKPPPGTSVVKPVILSRGTLVSKDLARARRFYENFLGLECVEYAPGAMMARDRDPKVLRQRKGNAYWVMDVRAATGGWQTNLFKHWGIDVASNAEVDRVHAYAVANKERLGIRAVRKPRLQHGTYSFYLEDEDGNWWEVECRPPGEETDAVFAHGDKHFA